MNISIKEGTVARLFDTVKKVLTKLQSGGNQAWVPETGTNLTTKSIEKNGVYRAEDDGDYGWSTVYVNVPTTDSVTGTDPDTGKTVTYNTDTSGNLVKREVPTSIAVITPPTNPYGIYTEGQTIKKDGMVVKAYYEDGSEWGVVPNNEITINPTTASISEGEYVPDLASSDLITGLDQPIPCSVQGEVIVDRNYTTATIKYHDVRTTGYTCDKVTLVINTETSYVICAASDTPESMTSSTIKEVTNLTTGDTEVTETGNVYPLNTSYTYDGKTVYYTTVSHSSSGFTRQYISPVATGNPSGHWGEIAWTMIYGDIIPGGDRQTIAVSWPRIGDGLVLETSFTISVRESMEYGGAEGGGGQTSGGGAGRT